MSRFLFLPDAKEIINLDQIQSVFLDSEVPADEPFEIGAFFSGNTDAVSFGHEDAKIILTAIAESMGISADKLAEDMREDDLGDDPFGVGD